MRICRQLFEPSATRARARFARGARNVLSVRLHTIAFCLAIAFSALGADTIATAGERVPAPSPAGKNPPQIVNFQAVEIVGGLWTISGDVIDAAPGGLTVTFAGEPVTLRGMTVVTDANGHFTLTLQLKTDGSDNGVVSAQTVDRQGLTSNLALDLIEAN